MGALQTLYAIVYGSRPGEESGKLREAPNRLQMYALEKLMRGVNAVGDYHDWMNDLDAQSRARESPSFDEAYMTPEDRERIEYFRKKYRETTGKELNIPATTTAVSGGPASGGIAPPTDVAAAEKKGETAGDRAISAYKAADKTSGDYTDFSSFMADYVRRAERDTAAADEERRNSSVSIGVQGREIPYDLGPGSYYSAPWDQAQKIVQQAGGTPGGGSFSAMESTVRGGDTEEDMRRYVDEYEFKAVDRQIDLIERAFPAANRPPALDEKLKDLYVSRSNRDTQATARQRLPIDQQNADTEQLAAEGLAEYHTNYGPAQRYVADQGVEEARIRQRTAQEQELRLQFQQLLNNAKEAATKDPDNAGKRAYLARLTAIIYDPKLTIEQKNKLIADEIGSPEGDVDQRLSEREALLFNKPGEPGG
jgi:hypothetical protein